MTVISAKGLYRRALTRIALKEEAEAEKDLVEATKLVNDQAISSELEKVGLLALRLGLTDRPKFKKIFTWSEVKS